MANLFGKNKLREVAQAIETNEIQQVDGHFHRNAQ